MSSGALWDAAGTSWVLGASEPMRDREGEAPTEPNAFRTPGGPAGASPSHAFTGGSSFRTLLGLVTT
jgi:hypothetical protein